MTARDLGDWQTPDSLSRQVFDVLAKRGVLYSRILEPTCGNGSFLRAALDALPCLSEIVGLDMQKEHLQQARAGAKDERLRLVHADVFKTDLHSGVHWDTSGPMLVVGNPPWVTSSELGSLGSLNLPTKTNLKGLSGLDAITGSANFDIAEYICIKILTELAKEEPTLAFLVKTSVARNVLKFSRQVEWPVRSASVHRFDALKAFGASVDACLFILTMGGSNVIEEVPVFESLAADRPIHTMGFSNGELVADIHAYRRSRHLDGASSLTWRQGTKHDASRVMELERGSDGKLRNKLGEIVDVEEEYIFPLLKGTQLYKGETNDTRRWVIVTQRNLKDDTQALQQKAPRLWAYLDSHREVLDSRKSSIYRNKPSFVMFGVGDYSFADFKIAVSGLHKKARFRLLQPLEGKPVMVDDTSYLLPCTTVGQAAVVKAVLDSDVVHDLLHALIFPDSKRPITKKLLQRIDLLAALDGQEASALLQEANRILEQEMMSGSETMDMPKARLTVFASY